MSCIYCYVKCETNLKDKNNKHEITLHDNNDDNDNNTGIIEHFTKITLF